MGGKEGEDKEKRRGKEVGKGSERGEKGVEEKEMMIDSPRVPMLSKPGPTCLVYAFSFSYRDYEIWSWKSLETLKRILFLMKKKKFTMSFSYLGPKIWGNQIDSIYCNEAS